jgi:hypothetical protein
MSKATSPGKAVNGAQQNIVTLRIELCDTDPLIWREIAVPLSIKLKTLHDIVQAAMGWTDSHLWTFSNGDTKYGCPSDGDDWRDVPLVNASKSKLQDLLKPRKTKLAYLYDFGDSWEHELTITGPRPGEPQQAYPIYLGGERNAPPDDCGGIPGFYEALDALTNPKHSDHHQTKSWFGKYDPGVVNKKQIESALAKIAKKLQSVKKSKPVASD